MAQQGHRSAHAVELQARQVNGACWTLTICRGGGKKRRVECGVRAEDLVRDYVKPQNRVDHNVASLFESFGTPHVMMKMSENVA